MLRFPLLTAALLSLTLVGQASAHPGPAGHDHAPVISTIAAPGETAVQHAGESVEHLNDGGDHDADGHADRALMKLVWHEMLFSVIVFLIFFGVLCFLVWPKILGGLKAREDKQRGDLVAAERAKRDAEAALAEYSEKLAEARKEAQSIVAEARTAAQQAANADKARIEADIAAMKASAKADIAAAKESALSDIYTQAASLSTTIAGKILQREINANDQQQLVNESVEQFKQKAASN